MATRKYLTNEPSPQEALRAIDERELIVKVTPRERTRWEGTAAQLSDEGLIPKKLEWPTGRRGKDWHAGGFSYSLQRCRPDGIKGPMSVWTSGDWWVVWREVTAERGEGLAPARLFAARCAYEHALWSQTPAARVQWMRYRMAQDHEEFQTFLKRATGELACTRQARSN